MNARGGWIHGGIILLCAGVASAMVAGCRSELMRRFDALEVGEAAPAECVPQRSRVAFGWADGQMAWSFFPAWMRLEAVRVLHEKDGTIAAKRMLVAEGVHGGLCRSHSLCYVFEARIPEDVYRDAPAGWRIPAAYETRAWQRPIWSFFLAASENEPANAEDPTEDPSPARRSPDAQRQRPLPQDMTLAQAVEAMRSAPLDIVLRAARRPESVAETATFCQILRLAVTEQAATRTASRPAAAPKDWTLPRPSNTIEYLLLLDEVMHLLPKPEHDSDLGGLIALWALFTGGAPQGAGLLQRAAAHPEAFGIPDPSQASPRRIDADGIPFTIRHLPNRRVRVEFHVSKCEPAFFGLEDELRSRPTETVEPEAIRDLRLEDVRPVPESP